MSHPVPRKPSLSIFLPLGKLGGAFILILCLTLFNACQDSDDFSSDKNLLLTFSTDTVGFDTVFTTIGSATRQFKIYNRNSNSLTIESIELMDAANSGFRMNIDGEKGTKLTNVDILKKDSLYGFVELTVDPTNSKNPVIIRDSIRFTVNGNVQYVRLEAIGQDVYIWKDKVVTADSVITGDKPLLIYNTLTVNKDVNLTVEKGTTFFLGNNAVVDIYGTIIANGDFGEPVVFRGSRFDNIEGGIPYDNAPGQWTGIIVHPDSYNNIFNNVIIKNAIRGLTFSESDTQYKKADLKNAIIQNTSEYGLLAVNCNIDVENSLFANSKGAPVTLQGGSYSFLHCTLANYYRWSARQMECLVVGNSYEGKSYALNKCDFINSIIYGSAMDELYLSGTGSAAYDYLFRNCLIKTPEQTNNHFENTIWNADPLFADLNSNGIYAYSFGLQQSSPAIDKADKSYSLQVPLDLNGHSRLSDSNPDIGCYEWVE